MVAWGGSTLLAALGVRMRPHLAPRVLQATLTSLLVRFRNKSPTVRGAATGLLTTLLPCGWLYVVVATAGGTARVIDAMLIMFVFWLGTLPMMVTIGLGAQRMFGAFQRRLPLAAAGAAVVLGRPGAPRRGLRARRDPLRRLDGGLARLRLGCLLRILRRLRDLCLRLLRPRDLGARCSRGRPPALAADAARARRAQASHDALLGGALGGLLGLFLRGLLGHEIREGARISRTRAPAGYSQ